MQEIMEYWIRGSVFFIVISLFASVFFLFLSFILMKYEKKIEMIESFFALISVVAVLFIIPTIGFYYLGVLSIQIGLFK